MRKQVMAAIVGLALSFVSGMAMATAQESDILVIDGKTFNLDSNPLDSWLEAHPDKRLRQGGVISSASWRGYVGHWEIKDGKLWLRKVVVEFGKGPSVRADAPDLSQCEPGSDTYLDCNLVADLFPEGGDILADWYSGILIVPIGELVEYVHMGYGSTYSKYLVLSVRKGEVTRQLDLNAKQYMKLRRERFKMFQKSKTYLDEIAATRKDLGDDADDFMFDYYAAEYMSEDPDAQAP